MPPQMHDSDSAARWQCFRPGFPSVTQSQFYASWTYIWRSPGIRSFTLIDKCISQAEKIVCVTVFVLPHLIGSRIAFFGDEDYN